MIDSPGTLYFDFTDPLSYFVDRELESVEKDLDATLERRGFELRPPPAALSAAVDTLWAERWTSAEGIADHQGVRLPRPQLVPWSRKAHELHLHASSLGMGAVVRHAIFDAFFTSGSDIGRIDALVQIAEDVGLDPTETKAILDVDRFQPDVLEDRQRATDAGVADTPTIIWGGLHLEGFHNRIALGTLLVARSG